MQARIDDRLSARVVSQRPLIYTRAARIADRPPHVRAASALAIVDGTMFVFQDDASWIGVVGDHEIDALAVPYVVAGRRRFEDALGNKLAKLDLEACLVDGRAVIGFGSGSRPAREQLCRLEIGTKTARLIDASRFYATLRAAVGALNVEGIALIGDELWVFHRGNTSDTDRPAIVRIARSELAVIVDGGAPRVIDVARCDLGSIDGTRLGFTDATAANGHVWIACAAEASSNAIDDGAVAGSRIGVVDRDEIRCAPLVGMDGRPCKVEGLGLDPKRPNTAWITLDPDDPETPSLLCEVGLVGPWIG